MIPGSIWYQLVYRQRRSSPFVVQDIPEFTYHYADRPAALLSILGPVRGSFGTAGLPKMFAKLLSGRRAFYCVTHHDRIASFGWAMKSWCRYYWVGQGEVVIGPTITDPEFRGRGLATYALKKAVNSLMENGHSVFYIDTSNDNAAAQRMIAKCDFGTPVAVYLRAYERGELK
jgi:GNAT superfamily N-acetyltransferase